LTETVDGVLGTGTHRYRIVEGWAEIPDGPGWSHDVASISVDSSDNVYAFVRGPHPVMVFDRDGKFLRSWGDGIFAHPHGSHIAADGCIYLTDDGDHTVRKFTLDGRLLLTIGLPHQPSPYMSNRPFNQCTHTALSPQGDIFVTDGYGNAALHKYAPDGKHLATWGGSGTDPGQFVLPHNLVCDDDGWVYVADRENHRVQVFDVNGRYQTQWNNMTRPCGLCMGSGKSPLFYISELGPGLAVIRNVPNFGPRITITDGNGAVVARLGAKPAGTERGAFIAPHGIAVDSRGDIYVGEVGFGLWPTLFPGGAPPPSRMASLKKLVKL
jgi:sugar lactone lactonase YvrE